MKFTNSDLNTIESFGDEWSRFDQALMTETEAKKAFDEYFSVFPWLSLPPAAEGFDMGCGSGRWARFVAPRVGRLNCVDPSISIEIARTNLLEHTNIDFFQASVEDSGLALCSQDFGYSLGVLHHVPNTAAAIRSCVNLLKPGAPLLLYLYYSLENRPLWFRYIWHFTDLARRVISRMPPKFKNITTDIIAVMLYWPLARISGVLAKFKFQVNHIPLSYYRRHTFYTMRTDSRDRFGTPLEQRFNKQQISQMMHNSGLVRLNFSEHAPYWCVVGFKASVDNVEENAATPQQKIKCSVGLIDATQIEQGALTRLAIFVTKRLRQLSVAVRTGASDFDKHVNEYSSKNNHCQHFTSYLLPLQRFWN